MKEKGRQKKSLERLQRILYQLPVIHIIFVLCIANTVKGMDEKMWHEIATRVKNFQIIIMHKKNSTEIK